MSERGIVKRSTTISPALHIGMRAYIWVEAFGIWQDGTWDGFVWCVSDNDTVENRFVGKWIT